MALFLIYYGIKYILMVVDYISKWVVKVALPNNDCCSVTKFWKKNIFFRFGTPHDIISDGGFHFCNRLLKVLL